MTSHQDDRPSRISGAANTMPLTTGTVVSLWPDGAPGTPRDFLPECLTDRSEVPGTPDRVLTQISQPRLTAFVPANPNGAAIIVAPGGGYTLIVVDKENREFVDFFGALGITVFILTYRLPGEGHENRSDVPLQDAQRALRLVRQRSSDWGLDPTRIGMLGCSAGGHVAASLIANHGREVYAPVDAADAVSARPDFGILLYPVITMDEPAAHAMSRRLLIGDDPTPEQIERHSPQCNVSETTPEVFLVLSDEDHAVSSENSISFYKALRDHGIPSEMHIFRDGAHGFGIERAADLPARQWPVLCKAWLARIAVI